MKEYYNDNSGLIIDTIAKLKTATDQTILNFMLVKNDIDVKILPDCYNLVDLFRKNLLHIPGHSWWEDSLENLYNSEIIWTQYQYNIVGGYGICRRNGSGQLHCCSGKYLPPFDNEKRCFQSGL